MSRGFDDDLPVSSGVAPGPLDGLFADKNKVILILAALCPCTSFIMLILSIICFVSAKTPAAKSNSKLILIIEVVLFVVGVVLNLALGLGGAILGGGGR